MAADRIWLTEDDEANALLARDPLALLIGFVLDQQVTVQKAFSGPLQLSRRLGRLDAAAIAAADPASLESVFKEKPALHRFPGSMAGRVQELCRIVADEYGGRAERIWTEARDADELAARIADLPGFGPMKTVSLMAVLARRLGVEMPGLAERLPGHACLGDIDSAEALAAYQAEKRARKAAARAEGA